MSYLFYTFLYNPLLNLLIGIYNILPSPNLALAVVIFTVLIRLILFPLFYKTHKNQTALQKIQPKIKTLMEEHKNNKEEQVKQVLALYNKHQINPLAGLGALFIQFPIIITLYYVFYWGFTPDTLSHLYSFISKPATINYSLLGLINLHEGSMVMAVIAAVSQYIYGHISLPKTKLGANPSSAEMVGRSMTKIVPFIILLIAASLPSVIALYWTISSLFSIGQQLIINYILKNKTDDRIEE